MRWKKEEWIRSIYTSSNTRTHWERERRRHIIANEICIINVELGKCLWLVFIFVNPIELHTYVSFLSKTQCKMWVCECVYAFWYEIHSLRWAYPERLIISFVNVWARTSPFTKSTKKEQKYTRIIMTYDVEGTTETQTEQKTEHFRWINLEA